MSQLKEQLYNLCAEYISRKEEDIKKIIADVQASAGEDTKSSAGDKYETGREVMQQEINLNLTRLNELKNQGAILSRILPGQSGAIVVPGSVVYTNHGNFYIAVSAGLLNAGGKDFYAISAASPIGARLAGREAGYKFVMNGKEYVVEEVE